MHAGRNVLTLSGAAAVALVAVLAAQFTGGPMGRPGGPADPSRPPPGSPDQLISLIRTTEPGPLAGTVRMECQLGPVGSAGPLDAAGGTQIARLWADGHGRRRIALPAPDSERTIVDDGHAVWYWNSATRSVTRTSSPSATAVLANLAELPGMPPLPARTGSTGQFFRGGELVANPAAMANALLTLLRTDSTIRVGPTTTIAHRSVYQLVLNPRPTERTLLREVRVAVDVRSGLPLEVSVSANGTTRPALRIGFTDLRFGPQNPALFEFTPAPGVPVRPARTTPAAASGPSVIGQGWDSVMVRRTAVISTGSAGSSALTAPNPVLAVPNPALAWMSSPISGPWGHGLLLRTAVGNAVFASDGRMAAGAVPAQVLSEALRPVGSR